MAKMFPQVLPQYKDKEDNTIREGTHKGTE